MFDSNVKLQFSSVRGIQAKKTKSGDRQGSNLVKMQAADLLEIVCITL